VQEQILGYVAKVNGIPESKLTEIRTDADPDDVAQVEKIINDTARDRDSTVNVDANTSAAEAAIRGLMSTMSNSVFFLHPKVAAATSAAGPSAGPAPGVTALGAGAAPAAFATPTARAAPASVLNQYTITVNVPAGAPTADVGRYVADALDAHERRTGSRRRAVA